MTNEIANISSGGSGNGNNNGNKWKLPVAGVTLLVLLGLVVYVTVRTGEIPITVVLPLIASASFALYNFKVSDWKKD